jgi:hypothetical protein
MQCHSRPPRSNSPYVGTPERSSTNTTAYAALTGPSTTPRSASSATFTKAFNPTLVRFCQAVQQLQRTGVQAFNPTLVRFCLGTTGPAGAPLPLSIPPWFDFAGYQFVIRAPNIEAVEKFAAAFGYLARQESVGYHRVEPITVGEHAERLAIHELPEEVRPQVLSQTNAVEIELDHAATVEEVKRLYNAIGRIAQQAGFDRDDLPIIPTRRGLRVLNFSFRPRRRSIRGCDTAKLSGQLWEKGEYCP